MSDILLKEIKAKIDSFLDNATDEDIRRVLKEANYEVYTGINPDNLSLHKPITNYNLSDNFIFSYGRAIINDHQPNYIMTICCYGSYSDNYECPYKKAA